MSEHPILRAIQRMRDDYAGSPGVDGAAPMERWPNQDET